jgi:hypothetical protein
MNLGAAGASGGNMKKLTIAALVAAQLLGSTQPALAADLAEARTQEAGMFAGFRLRVPLAGEQNRQPVRAGLALAPTVQSRAMNGGEVRTRFGEGLELGFNGRQPVALSFAGTPVSRLAQGPAGPDGHKAGVSTLGWVAIGVGVVAVSLFALYGLCGSGEICSTDDE